MLSMGKSTISITIFNSELLNYQRVSYLKWNCKSQTLLGTCMMGYPKDQTHGDGPPITRHIGSVTSATSQDIYNSYKVVPNSFVL